MGAAEKREPGDLLTTREAARVLRLTPAGVRSLVTRGRLKPDVLARKYGLKSHRFKAETIEAFLKGGDRGH